jgi:hypothetical protein
MGLGLSDRQDWLVLPCSRTRDSEALDRANFDAALESLGGWSDTVETHRFGHWGPGWFGLILVKPGTEAERIAREIESALADYPVLDDERLSEYERDDHDATGCDGCDRYDHDELDPDDVEYEIGLEPMDSGPEGFFATGDDVDDENTCKLIRHELDRGNEWAWCVVTVTATWGRHEGSASLGAVSWLFEYAPRKSKRSSVRLSPRQCFESSEDYAELKREALADLKSTIRYENRER